MKKTKQNWDHYFIANIFHHKNDMKTQCVYLDRQSSGLTGRTDDGEREIKGFRFSQDEFDEENWNKQRLLTFGLSPLNIM